MKQTATYSDDHEDAQVDEDIAIVVGPMGHNLGLLNSQIVTHEGEIGKQADDLLLG